MLDMNKTEAGYQAPRIVTHSALALEGAALAVNACTGFSPGRVDDSVSTGNNSDSLDGVGY